MSTLQELVVDPVLGFALWKLLQASLDALMILLWEDKTGP